MPSVLAIALLAATGFYHMDRDADGRWTLIDAGGRATFLRGVDHVRYGGVLVYRSARPYSHYKDWNDAHYPSVGAWADESAARLRAWGFNAIGGGASEEMMSRGFAYCRSLKLSNGLTVGADGNLSGRGREGLWICPHEGSPCTEFPNVFHPDFSAYCDRIAAEKCAPHREDHDLVGYFLDNELAWWGRGARDTGLFDAAMRLPSGHTARLVAEDLIVQAGFSATGAVPASVKRDFLRLAADRYFSIAADAVRRHDPNHLVLGARFAGLEVNDPIVFEAAGRKCDIITFNCYPWADLDRNVVFTKRLGGERIADAFRRVYELSGRPLFVTEWSFPALDTQCPCTCGAGQRFRTQSERARASELFVRTMFALPYLVGYNYFMWVDEPPEGISKAYPEDSNYGLVNEKGEPYPELTQMFARVQEDVDGLRHKPVPAERAISDRDIMTAGKFAAKHGIVGSKAFKRTGEEWSWSNAAGLTLKGALGEGRIVRRAVMKNRELGSVGAMVQHRTDRMRWDEVDFVTDVRLKGDASLEIVAERKVASGVRFSMTFCLTLDAARPEYLFELVGVRNLGEVPIAVKGLFLCQYSPFAGERVPAAQLGEKTTSNQWKGWCETAWCAADGRIWGARTKAPYLVNFYYYVDSAGLHPDAVYAPADFPSVLSPGENFDCRGRVWNLGFGDVGKRDGDKHVEFRRQSDDSDAAGTLL